MAFYQEHPEKTRIVHNPILKLAEDILLYDVLSAEQWNDISLAFDAIYPEEIARSHNQTEIIKQWHLKLKNYCLQPPCLHTHKDLLFSQQYRNLLDQPYAIEELEELLNDSTVQERLYEFYTNFISLLCDEMVTTPDWAYTNIIQTKSCDGQLLHACIIR